MRKKYSINLVIKRRTKIGEEIVYFLIHYFRYILVITQIIIIIVFFYRLKVDQEVVELSDTLLQQKEILRIIRPFIEEIQQKHNRYLQVKAALEQQRLYHEKLNYLLSVFPANFYLRSLIFKGDGSIYMDGRSIDYVTVMRFYNRVKKDGRFEQVKLKEIDKEGEFYIFSFDFSGFKFNTEEKK